MQRKIRYISLWKSPCSLKQAILCLGLCYGPSTYIIDDPHSLLCRPTQSSVDVLPPPTYAPSDLQQLIMNPLVFLKAVLLTSSSILCFAALIPPKRASERTQKLYTGQPFEYLVRILGYIACVRSHITHSYTYL